MENKLVAAEQQWAKKIEAAEQKSAQEGANFDRQLARLEQALSSAIKVAFAEARSKQ